jgi:hypothetical protein
MKKRAIVLSLLYFLTRNKIKVIVKNDKLQVTVSLNIWKLALEIYTPF